MPVRVSDIPGLSPTRINSAPMDPRAAAAPFRALGELGETFASISQPFAAIAGDLQKADNQRKESEIRIRLEEAGSKFFLDLQSDIDPVSRGQKTDEFLQQQKALVDDPELSPDSRERIALFFDGWASDARINNAKTSASLTMERAKATFQNEIKSGFESNDLGRVRRGFDSAVAAGVAIPEEWDGFQRDFDQKQRKDSVVREIHDDPRGWMERNEKPPSEGELGEWQKNQELARALYRREAVDVADQFQDMLAAGQITDPKQIDERFADQRPAVIAEMKATLARRNEDLAEATLASPEAQNRIIGQASALMDSYNPDGVGFDSAYVKISGLISGVKDEATRGELEKQLDAIRNGAEQEVKTHSDEAFKALGDAYKSGRFGNSSGEATPPTMSLQRAISDGILQDKKKLSAFFPSDVVDNIAEGKINVNGDKPKDPLSDNERAELFRSELGKLPPEKQEAALASLSRMDRALFEGLRDRKGFSTEIVGEISPEAEDAAISAKLSAEENYGRAKVALGQFLRVNPKATPSEINDKIFEIAGEEARKKLSSGFFDPKPTRSSGPKGADDSTSQVPIGKDLKSVVRHFEAGGGTGGFHRAAYWDFGQWSIGYGTKAKEGEVIDEAEAERRLDAELSSHRKRVVDEAKSAGITLAPHELDALTSFDYNTGRISQLLAGGTRTKAEIAEKMLLYRNADGQRLRGLERRRQAERQLFLTGYTS